MKTFFRLALVATLLFFSVYETLNKPKTKKKIYSSGELKKELVQQYGDEKWGKAMIKNIFSYW